MHETIWDHPDWFGDNPNVEPDLRRQKFTVATVFGILMTLLVVSAEISKMPHRTVSTYSMDYDLDDNIKAKLTINVTDFPRKRMFQHFGADPPEASFEVQIGFVDVENRVFQVRTGEREDEIEVQPVSVHRGRTETVVEKRKVSDYQNIKLHIAWNNGASKLHLPELSEQRLRRVVELKK